MEKRLQILAAAERVLQEKGLTGATTREIAREAGCAEGTIYLHFADRLELFSALLDEFVPDVKECFHQLNELAGKKTVRQNLETVAERCLYFYDRAQSVIFSIFAEPVLMQAHRERMARKDRGPQRAERLLADYLRAEQRQGRVDKRIAPETAASMLMGACFYRVFTARYLGTAVTPAPKVFARKLVDSLLQGIAAASVAPEEELVLVGSREET